MASMYMPAWFASLLNPVVCSGTCGGTEVEPSPCGGVGDKCLLPHLLGDESLDFEHLSLQCCRLIKPALKDRIKVSDNGMLR